ncbi:hypothetical protein BLSTO_05649 [Blastocystis sp. subtype 1]
MNAIATPNPKLAGLRLEDLTLRLLSMAVSLFQLGRDLCWFGCVGGEREENVEKKAVLNVSGIEHKQVLDLNDDGERWEGDVLNNQPYGWGVLYDSENRMAYEGFRIGEAYVCYGTRYYSDIQRVEYEGEWCEGKRWGRGVQYDRRGNSVFEGEWLNDEHEMEKKVVVSDDRPTILHNRVEELLVPSESRFLEDWKSLECSLMPRLRVLAIGGNCSFAGAVELVGADCLESVAIGGSVSTASKPFVVKDCPALKTLVVGNDSFSGCSSCVLRSLPMLESVRLGTMESDEKRGCFRSASLEVRNLPMLKMLVLGDGSFDCCSKVILEDLPELVSIDMGSYAASTTTNGVLCWSCETCRNWKRFQHRRLEEERST